ARRLRRAGARRHPGPRAAAAGPLMAGALLEIHGLVKRFGGFTALNRVTLHVKEGERFGLIGPNGSGKTTLINCVSGSLRPDDGRIVFAGRDITALPAHQRTRLGIARSFQIPKPFTSMTVQENLDIPLEYAGHARARDADRKSTRLNSSHVSISYAV